MSPLKRNPSSLIQYTILVYFTVLNKRIKLHKKNFDSKIIRSLNIIQFWRDLRLKRYKCNSIFYRDYEMCMLRQDFVIKAFIVPYFTEPSTVKCAKTEILRTKKNIVPHMKQI